MGIGDSWDGIATNGHETHRRQDAFYDRISFFDKEDSEFRTKVHAVV